MDDQVTLRTYGNTELPEGTEDRPLVTFALFAYNQEKYIREAVEGAFSQTYSPLEIILSDDCSNDKTFEIIEEMAKAYHGKHLIRIRRSDENLHVVDHIVSVARLASGSLFVVAAGDDISYPERSEMLCREWLKTDAIALYSKNDEIDDNGKKIRGNVLFPTSLPGFCAAYRTDFWSSMPEFPKKLKVEDGLASWILRVREESPILVQEPLMAYRVLLGSLSGRGEPKTVADVWRREQRIDADAQEILNRLNYVLVFEIKRRGASSETLYDIEQSKRHAQIIAGFWSRKFSERVKLLAKARAHREFMFLLPRMPGRFFFQSLRLLVSRIRR